MRVNAISFADLPAVELVDRGHRLVVVHGAGPRIAWLGRPQGENLLYWDADAAHRRGEWRLMGGHRLWVTRPGADEAEETYLPDQRPCKVRRLQTGVVVTAPADALGLERSLVVRLWGQAITVDHRLTNRGDMLWSGGAWALTCTRPGKSTVYEIPLGDPTASWDAFSVVIPRRWGGGHTSRVDDPQLAWSEDLLTIRAQGQESKRMLEGPQGLLRMRQRGLTFSKQAAYQRGAPYPLGCNLAVYLAPEAFMVELETMSPQRTLMPGQTLSHVETWRLT